MKYFLYTAQTIIREYIVEAESEEQARELVSAGKVTPCHEEAKKLQFRFGWPLADQTLPAGNIENNDMSDAEILQWIDACNHEPAKAVLRNYLALRSPKGSN
ncbi:hypothetical protein EVB39_072 [Rhizobium phage RHph_TM3_3_9]|nr:hypothetical protein EVB39_072 [Rhizobium phage RHph_TM3_3_9]QIG68593.1 hypothetical protein EVB66_072 [Rhizobium phage RHph_TM3_3_13]QIG74451.1 hypothetical protein EVC09_071 [Rhizobium phage RHph_TM3_3_10]QXV74565.1 hypothetical protein [Rhizobium phage RHEph19]